MPKQQTVNGDEGESYVLKDEGRQARIRTFRGSHVILSLQSKQKKRRAMEDSLGRER